MADRNALSFSVIRTATDHTGPNVIVSKIEHPASGFVAYAYQCRLEEDFDGAPAAYGIDNPHPVDPAHNPSTRLQRGLQPLDNIANATMPHQSFEAGSNVFVWVGVHSASAPTAHFSIDQRARLEARGMKVGDDVVPLPPGHAGKFPVIQGPEGPEPGYYVSTSSFLADRTLPEWNQRRYVDASEIPYAAYAGWWKSLNVSQGDLGVAIRPDIGRVSGFVFADAGTSKVGEVSNKLMETLSPGEGRGTRNEHPTLFLVFPRSGGGLLDKFSSVYNTLLQGRVISNIHRLNTLPDNGRITMFLALGADARKYDAVVQGRQAGGNYLARYRTIELALKLGGFAPSSHYEMVL